VPLDLVREGRIKAATREPGDLPSRVSTDRAGCPEGAADGGSERRVVHVVAQLLDAAPSLPLRHSHAESVVPTSASSQASHPAPIATAQPTSIAAQAVVAIALGMLIVGMAGFSPLDVVHNAAHDTRHSNAFPCH
jgi:cobalt transporter subunit CbtB